MGIVFLIILLILFIAALITIPDDIYMGMDHSQYFNLTKKLNQIMSTQDDILAEIAAIKTDVAAGAAAAQTISTEIAALQAALAAANAASGSLSPVAIEAALNDLKTGADALAASLGNVSASGSAVV